MRILGLSLSLSLFVLLNSFGQVAVEVSLEQDLFLPSESIPAAVRVSNRSGQTLELGKDDEWLTFVVESRDNALTRKLGEVPVTEKFSLESSKVATRRADIQPYFDLGKPGRYKVTATVHIKEWNQDFASKPKNFEIVTGTKLWEQEFGMPPEKGATNAEPEVRKFILQQANYLKQLRLYVRLTDASGLRTYRVFIAGAMSSVSRPEPQLDKSSNLHLLWQTGPRYYIYIIINPGGEMIVRRAYDYLSGVPRPRLQADAAGNFTVAGGQRHPTQEDIPAENPVSPNDTQTPAK